jgi:hypothetical protein
MPEVQLKKLRAIKGNLAKAVKDKDALRRSLKVFFQSLLNRGQYQFQNKLKSEAVSESFRDTIASKRLYKSFDRNINRALQITGGGNLQFGFGIKKGTGTKLRPDPSEYYDAIDSNDRKGGPSLARVMEWMKERGILQKIKGKKTYRKTVTSPSGNKVAVRRVAFAILMGIKRKTQAKQYKALKLTQMFADIINIKDPESFFRQEMRKQVVNLALGKTG